MQTLAYQAFPADDRRYPRVSRTDDRLTITWPAVSVAMQWIGVVGNVAVGAIFASIALPSRSGATGGMVVWSVVVNGGVGLMQFALAAAGARDVLRWPDLARTVVVDRDRIGLRWLGPFGPRTYERAVADVVGIT